MSLIYNRWQFHQHSTSSFYTCRARKCKKDSQIVSLFCIFRICAQKKLLVKCWLNWPQVAVDRFSASTLSTSSSREWVQTRRPFPACPEFPDSVTTLWTTTMRTTIQMVSMIFPLVFCKWPAYSFSSLWHSSWCQFNQHFTRSFLYKSILQSFSPLTIWVCIFLTKWFWQKSCL